MKFSSLLLLSLVAACSSTTTSGGDGGMDGSASDGGCLPVPIHCSRNCAGVEPPAMCIGGTWTCPAADVCDANVPDASDGGAGDGGCLLLPIHCLPDCSGMEPPAMCIAGTLVCPMPPVCDGGASDAGTTFACGLGTMQCTRNTQYCDLSDVSECLAIPSSCPNPPTCACLSGMGHTSCVDDGAGGITTRSPGG